MMQPGDQDVDLRASQGAVVNPTTVTQTFEGRQSLTDEVYAHGRVLAGIGADMARVEAREDASEHESQRRSDELKTLMAQFMTQLEGELHGIRTEMRQEFAAIRMEMARLPRRRRYLVYTLAWFFLTAPTLFFFLMYVKLR